MLRTLIFTASLLSLSAYVSAEPLSIFNQTSPAPTLPAYSDSSNLSPAFHVWQNDPELMDFYAQTFSDGSGVTDLCIPSSMADLLLYQISQRNPKLDHLNVPGVTNPSSINGAS